MLEEVCSVNSRISVNCLKRRYPHIDIQKDIIKELNEEYDFWVKIPKKDIYEQLTAAHVHDKNLWLSNFFFDRFYAKIIEKTDNPGLGYGMGREFFLDREIMNLVGPIINVKGLIDRMPSSMKKWNHTKKGIVKENSNGHFKFAIAHKPGIIVSPFAIDYHLGIFDGVAEVCGLVGFETQLIKADKENHYYEFEGRYEHKPRLIRLVNQYFIKKLSYVARSMEVARQNTIKNRGAHIRERLLKEKESRAKKKLQKFVSHRVLEHCIDNDLNPERTLEKSYLSIMFSDIRDFTELSERIDNEILADLLNEYFEVVTQPIELNGGWIDKYVGDAIMAFFNTAYGSVISSINMRTELRKFNDRFLIEQKYMKSKIDPIRSGIGISTGYMLLGNIGSDKRMDESVIGDKVNTASRLEGLTKIYRVPIIIDEDTHQDIKEIGMIADYCLDSDTRLSPLQAKKDIEAILNEGKIFTREIDIVRPKGKKKELKIYEVMNSFSLNVLFLITEYKDIYEKALRLSYCKSTDPKKIQESLQESMNLFKQIDQGFKEEYNGLGRGEEKFLSEDRGDYICQQKIKANQIFLRKLKSDTEFFENPDWFIKNFNEK